MVSIHRTQRDLPTGLDFHLVGLGQSSTRPMRWESSIEIDLGVFVQERVRRSKNHIDAAANKKRIQGEAMLTVQKMSNPHNESFSAGCKRPNISTHKGSALPHYTGTVCKNATMLAAKIIQDHIDATKKIILMYGAPLKEHMIILRKKTDYDLSQVLVGNFSYVNGNGRIEMMMKAEESARVLMNHATGRLPQSNSPLMPDNRNFHQAALHSAPVAYNVTATSQSTPSIDLNEILKSGSPFDWSKQVVQHHKDFIRSLCLKYGHTTFPNSELEGSRCQCNGHLNTIFEAAGLQYACNQISAVIEEAENEVREEFLASSNNSTSVVFQTSNNNWHTQQQPINVNAATQPLQKGSNGLAALQIGVYSSQPQQITQETRRSSLLPYNQNLSTQGNYPDRKSVV